ncbi:alkaline phosphatase [Vagococcus acidifermentans]|uniref:Alkaline phosphatase n=1 Tax=Vagococcus acidifermentans TaxID=564710 RepID=A0A430AY81_9ENTE|nr:alkaline phosphatase [Vagococcus acidifermentans]
MILSTLKKEKSLSLKKIMSLTNVSRDTARRDIVTLTENNLVRRTYGGIAQLDSFKELDSFLTRSSHKSREKFLLAKEASKLIAEDDLVYLDVSTTVSLVPQNLPEHLNNLIVTNSIDIANQLLTYSNCHCRLLGGNLDKKKRCVVGTKPLRELDDYLIDLAVIGVVGIDEKGVYYAYEEDIEMKRKIRLQSKKIALLVDSTKIGEAHKFRVFNFDEIDAILVTAELPGSLLRRMKEHHVEIIQVAN